MDPSELLGGLDEAQREAVTSPAGPLCVHAGAGSGKTRVLTRRIAYRAATGDIDPTHAVALTFSRKAAAELRSRLHALGLRDSVAAGTFHSVAYAQLRRYWEDRRKQVPELLLSKGTIVGELLGPKRTLTSAVVAELDWAAARRIGPSDYLEQAALNRRQNPLPGAGLPELMQRYEAEKRKRGLVDFDDLLSLAITAMATDKTIREARWWMFRHLFVDEYQDVNPLQQRLVRMWLGERDDLFVVGDPHQAIYGWNGADARFIDRFEDAFPADRFPNRAKLRLRDNYRSSPQILAAAAAVLNVAPLRPHRPDGPPPVVSVHEDDDAEVVALARSTRDAHAEGVPWAAQAVLARTGAQVASISSALDRHGIPNVRRGAGHLLRRPTVKATMRRLNREQYGLVVGDFAPEPPLPEADGRVHEDPERDPEDLDALAVLAREYESLESTPTGPGFAAWLVTALSSDDRIDRDAVVVSTFHAAKGLEWRVVHITGVEDGYVPHVYASSPEERDEEQRLLYVAMTRAEQQLRLSWARRRQIGERVRERVPSPWLADVEARIEQLHRASEPTDGRRHLARVHETVRSRVTKVEDPVVGRLEAWRAQAARAARVSAEAILDDLTLKAIADARPTDADALVGVPGLGPVKAARFGEELLAAVRPTD